MNKFKTFIFSLFVFSLSMTCKAYGFENYKTSTINETPTLLEVANTANTGYKNASSDSIQLYSEKETVVQVFNNNSENKLYLTNKDIDLMSRIVFAESKGEPYEGKVAVASVILNRATSKGFPSSIEGVIKQKNAFSCVVNGSISKNFNSECQRAVLDAIKGIDPTNDALYFYNPKSSTCNWMKQIKKRNEKPIGNHVFFQI